MSAERTVELPERAGNRPQARAEIGAQLPDDLTGIGVTVDGSRLAYSAPSYLDEVVKIVLVERGASRLTLTRASDMTAGFVTAAAQRRQVSDRLRVNVAR